MSRIILIAPSAASRVLFDRVAQQLREYNHNVHVYRCFDTSAGTMRIECGDKNFALVGLMGDRDEIGVGYSALANVAKHCPQCAIGICLDEMGYLHYGGCRDVPAQQRIRMAVLSGDPLSFPHVRSMVHVGGRMIRVEEWSQEKVGEIVSAILTELRKTVSGV